MTTIYTDPVTHHSYVIPVPEDEGEARPSPKLTDLAVIIPAYNEQASIGDTLCELRESCPEAEIIVVDDGSTDATGDIARSIDDVRVVCHTSNRGYGASLKTGIRATRRSFVAW